MDRVTEWVLAAPDDFILKSYFVNAQPLAQKFAASVGDDYATIIAFMLMIFLPLLVMATVFFFSLGPSVRNRPEMASAVPSFLHGSLTFLVGSVQVAQHLLRGNTTLDTDNTAAQVMLLQFSCAYFIVDTLAYIGLFARHEVLFAVHHVVVTSYMLLTMRLGYGAISAIAMLTLGEATSPLQNVWFILRNLRYSYKWADDQFAWLSYVYAAHYVTVRSVIGPNLVVVAGYVIYTSERFSGAVKTFMLVALAGATAGSQMWSLKISSRLRSAYRPAFNPAAHASTAGAVKPAGGAAPATTGTANGSDGAAAATAAAAATNGHTGGKGKRE